jgi:mono/diheme cytochrome c family protein
MLIKRFMWVAVAALVLAPMAVFADDAKVEKGMQVYTAQKCSMCHSIAGKGNAKGSLDGVGSKWSLADIKQWIVDPVGMRAKTKAERKPPMKAKPMPADDIDALVAYLATLKK